LNARFGEIAYSAVTVRVAVILVFHVINSFEKNDDIRVHRKKT